MSYYTDHWRIKHFNEPKTALRLPGKRFKSYTYRQNVFVELGEDNVIRFNFLYAINTNKDSTTFELMYSMSKNGKCPTSIDWTPVPLDVIERLFKSEDGTWNLCNMYSNDNSWVKNTKFKVVDGHFLFKFNTRWLRDKLGSISVDSIHYSILGRFVYEMDEFIGIALVNYPERKYTLDDAKAINNAVSCIKNVAWTIQEADESQMTWRKRRLFERLQNAKSDLAEYEKKYQEILDKAADAMNLMSSKYGIEIDI